MDFKTAALKNLTPSTEILTLAGRASRSEYWWTYLAALLVIFSLQIVVFVLQSISPFLAFPVMLIGFAFNLFFIVTTFTCSVRRFHDVNKNGWNYLWILLPIAGPLYILYLTVKKGDEAANQYGEPPL